MADAHTLLEEIRQGQLEALRARFARNDYPARAFLSEPRAWGEEMWMPIHHAAACGQKAVVELLLSLDISVDARTRFHTPMHARQTALHFAAIAGDRTTAALLLDRGAEVEVRDADGRSPLAWAARHGRAELVRLFCEHQAMVDAADLQGRSPLHLALIGPDAADAPAASEVLGPHPCPGTTTEDQARTVAALISAAADVDARCPREPAGYTPLHRCISLGESRLSCARALLTAGADPHLADPRFGRSALDWARDQGASAYLELLETFAS